MLRDLPAVDELLKVPEIMEKVQIHGRTAVLLACRSVVEQRRQTMLSGGRCDPSTLIKEITLYTEWLLKPQPRRVVNATGILLHTNLGRAPLSKGAQKAIQQAAEGYSDLELDLKSGKRGARAEHCERLLCHLTGAEDAVVVNNNAAAVLLCLTVLAKRRRVIISRSQLVEIGGGFRVPEVMKLSGARLVEVGTTNKVHEEDYKEALAQPAAVLMRVHPSNFRIRGFTREVELVDLAEIAHRHNAVMLDDLGSGALRSTSAYGLPEEPLVQESIREGADLVCFSGDKLLGGPQAGIILGKINLIAKLRKHPLARALRADKLCLASLSATLVSYISDNPEGELPVWKMIADPAEKIKQRVENWRNRLGFGIIQETRAAVGGGSLPDETLPSWSLLLETKSPLKLSASLRDCVPAILCRIEKDKVVLDARCVLEDEDEILIENVRKVVRRMDERTPG